MKKLFYLLCCVAFLSARENPFESLTSPNTDTHINEEKKSGIFESFDFKLPSTARILKEIKVIYQNIDGSVEEQLLDINKDVDWHYPISISQKDAIVTPNSDFVTIGKIIFFTKDNKLFITTNRKIERDFILPAPFRIIIDFDKQDADIDELKELNQKYFTSVNLIRHKNFYRAIITLDGHYKYEITKIDDGYQLSLQ